MNPALKKKYTHPNLAAWRKEPKIALPRSPLLNKAVMKAMAATAAPREMTKVSSVWRSTPNSTLIGTGRRLGRKVSNARRNRTGRMMKGMALPMAATMALPG